ncbi:aminoacyl-tRNA deacylase [Litoribrevibacter euphylliae]|uniref:Aminoacyl-tRNA deacylase n=1 Tax=Litoribrevibacter euphylliae TaxID=1834034 RepID=A0ABV7HBN5_9GAMM
MSIARNLATYLNDQAIHYQTIFHPESHSASDSARSANIPLHNMVKAILLNNGDNYLIALIPADHKLDISRVNKELMSHWSFAKETDLTKIFQDCTPGSIPAVPSAYHLSAIWSSCLSDIDKLYMESGDDKALISMSNRQFMSLIATQAHGNISHFSTGYPPSSAQFDAEDNGAEY